MAAALLPLWFCLPGLPPAAAGDLRRTLSVPQTSEDSPWLGTGEGPGCFDGIRMAGCVVSSLHEDSARKLWAGIRDSGLYRLLAVGDAGPGDLGALTLHPRFYGTRWFQLLVGGLLLVLGWVSLQWHRRHLVGRLARAEADVRERTRHEEILRLAREEADHARVRAERAHAETQSANAAKSEFLSRLSHELRTPLNAILGFGQLLELEPATPTQTESIEHILAGGRHLLGLVDEILDLTRVESGAAPVRLEPVAVAPLLAEIAGLLGPLAQERGVRLRVEGPAAVVSVLAAPQRLKQVMLNLLSNALQYNRPGGEAVIGVEPTRNDAAHGRIFVRDTGMGIDPAGLSKLFVPFERLGAAYGSIKGSGLGLTVSKQLVEAMGGAIGVESTPQVGSNFWVELPVAPEIPAPAPLPPTDPMPVAASPRPSPSEPPSPTGPSLLYIEDNASNRHLVQSVLAQRRPDLTVRCAEDGLTGLTIASTPPYPGLILLDLQLPDLPGEEILAQLRAEETTREIPVAVLSADATVRSRQRLLEAGAADYLTKPLDLRSFLEMLATHCPPPDPA